MSPKLLFASGGVALSGTVGLGIWKLSSSPSEIFKDKLKSEFKDSKWKILDSEDLEEWIDVKAIYDLSTSPKIKKGELNLASSYLPSWCVDTLNKVYSSENWNLVRKYCLVNTNSILQELGDKAIPVSANVDTEWLPAWKNYRDEKAKHTSLQIEDSEIKAADDETKGKAAIKKWCESVYGKRMYKNGSESSFSLAAKWCVRSLEGN